MPQMKPKANPQLNLSLDGRGGRNDWQALLDNLAALNAKLDALSALNLQGAVAPVNGTSEIQTLTIGGTPAGGTFTLSYDGIVSPPIAWSATNGTLVANVDAALEAILGAGAVTTAVNSMTAGVGTINITFTGIYAKRNVPQLVAASSLAGTNPTAAVTTATPGVEGTGRTGVGQIYRDTVAGKLYLNKGTLYNPDWVEIAAA